MVTEISFRNYVKQLFQVIESEIDDLIAYIDNEYQDEPVSRNKLMLFKNECVAHYEKLKAINLNGLEDDDPDTCYRCAEISTDIFELIKKLQNNRPL